ncbi:SagB/ThcOx family dehydrogenase [Patescibacteria group bacterium]|nr:SagB/ThcOx family dehydrogenase [Patescibacteria group bacterium]MBU1256817.1 SagB/ThcOx family dehydrogenase [Patescibacteria group bacterium]MBU1457649.1 SagB/ThcOx family dehydrogenase [Patescibacteria group bacterium]
MPALKKQKKDFIVPLTTIGIVFLLVVASLFKTNKTHTSTTLSLPQTEQESDANLIDLPYPNKDSKVSLEKALNNWRSYTSFQDKPLSLNNLSQLLWSAQGVTVDWGGRTVYSSKSAYPLSIYAVTNQVTDIDQGLYKYIPGDLQPAHQLYSLYKADLRQLFIENTKQYSLQHAPLILIITSNTNKIEAYLEAGHATQNLFLQSESLGLGMAEISNIDQDVLKEILQIPEEETIIYLIPVGLPKK